MKQYFQFSSNSCSEASRYFCFLCLMMSLFFFASMLVTCWFSARLREQNGMLSIYNSNNSVIKFKFLFLQKKLQFTSKRPQLIRSHAMHTPLDSSHNELANSRDACLLRQNRRGPHRCESDFLSRTFFQNFLSKQIGDAMHSRLGKYVRHGLLENLKFS